MNEINHFLDLYLEVFLLVKDQQFVTKAFEKKIEKKNVDFLC